jgi:ATP-dependent Lon protease
MASSIYSIATGKILAKGLAMTGELTLTGRVLPVGGIKEKIIAAKRGHLKRIIIPKENRKDKAEIPEYVKKGLKFYFVENIEEVINIAFNRKG